MTDENDTTEQDPGSPALGERIADAGESNEVVAFALDFWTHHNRMAGSLMAGAIAYRFFIVMLPLAVVLLAGAGLVGRLVQDGVARTVEDMGLAGYVAESVARAADISTFGLWAFLVAGVVALLWASFWTARALRTVYTMAWRLKVRRQPHAGRAMLVFMALVILFAATSTGFYALARLGPLIAVISGVGMIMVDLAFWWLAMWLLPHKPARPKELLPGAGVLTAGIAILTLTTGLFMWRLEESSSMYGPLGLALVLLFWLYLIGHLFVGAAVLNAELWERVHTDPEERAAARRPRVDEESAMAEAFTEAARDSGAADRRTRGLHRKEQR